MDTDRLINLSAGTTGAQPANAGLVGASDAGDRVYFTATGQVVPGEGTAGPKLYLWEDDGSAQGTVRFIATLSAAVPGGGGRFPRDSYNWSWTDTKRAQVSSDGSQLVFQSRATIDGIDGYDPGGTAQVYVYDADAAGGSGDFACVSCMGTGAAAGSALVPTRENGFQEERPAS